MKESVKYLLAVGLLLLLLPFLLTVMLSGKDAVEVSKNIDLEMLLPSVLYREIPDDARDEMIRAQAVLIRSRLYLRIQNGEAASVLKENRIMRRRGLWTRNGWSGAVRRLLIRKEWC